MNTIICRIKSYIQPFERKLALLELSTICNAEPTAILVQEAEPCDYQIVTDIPIEQLINRLSYWESVFDNERKYTIQVMREATVNVVRNGVTLEQIRASIPFTNDIPLPNRRCLRYGTHGIHEYRGKFFPQLVRALINISGINAGSVIADPMSGSGTTIVEAILSGCHAIGLDINPLSILMGKIKCGLLSIKSADLENAYKNIHNELLRVKPSQSPTELKYFLSLPDENINYLKEWFSEQVLIDLDQIVTRINDVEDEVIKDFMRLSLSNIIRKISWQKEDDLRVRKEIRTDVEIDPIKEFLEELSRSVRVILAFLYQNQNIPLGKYNIIEGDARELPTLFGQFENKVDCIITSPPYATALPYLDTDRLSLGYLGLLHRNSHRLRERTMIGNREVTEKLRLTYWQEYQEKKSTLPLCVIELIELIDKLNASNSVGFRRKNLSALLAKYFLDMRQVMIGINYLLKPGAYAFIIVGNNHTVAGDEKIDIKTAELLADVAISIGLNFRESIPMDMLTSRDIFKKNAMASETILCLQK